eukprot:UN23164
MVDLDLDAGIPSPLVVQQCSQARNSIECNVSFLVPMSPNFNFSPNSKCAWDGVSCTSVQQVQGAMAQSPMCSPQPGTPGFVNPIQSSNIINWSPSCIFPPQLEKSNPIVETTKSDGFKTATKVLIGLGVLLTVLCLGILLSNRYQKSKTKSHYRPLQDPLAEDHMMKIDSMNNATGTYV